MVQLYKRAYRSSLFWAVAAILPSMLYLLLAILLLGGLGTAGETLVRAMRFTWPRSWIAASWQIALPILFAAGLWEIAGFFWSWLRTRRSGAIHTPARWAMWANAVVNLLEWVAALLMAAGAAADIIQGDGSVAAFAGCAIGGVIVCLMPFWMEEIYPREFRQMRIGGLCITVISILIIAATWGYGGDTVYLWTENGDYVAYHAGLEEEPIVRDIDYGIPAEGSYTLSQGVGPAGRYTILMNDLNREMNDASCSRYDCYTNWLAKWAMEALKREAETPGEGTARVGTQLWTIWSYNASRLEQVELSWADEAWYGVWTTNEALQSEASEGTVLVLRKGNVAVRICARVDLLDGEIQQTVRARLGL